MPAPSAPSVLQVLTTNQRRGAETFAVQLGEALAPLVGRIETVALEPGPGAPLDVPTLAGSRRDPAGLRRLRRLARSADVVVAHGSATLWAAAAATAGTRTPFVYRLIGDPTFWTTRLDRRLRVALALRRAAAVAAYYPAAAEALSGHLRLPAGHVRVIPKGIDLADHPAVSPDERLAARRSLGVEGEGPVLAWIGALAPEKRPGLALDVAEALPGARLLVAGTGPLHDALATRSGPSTHLLGALADPRPVVAAADVLVVTSVTEGVPGVALEAAASGVPVVAVDVGGLGQVVLDGRTGRLVDEASQGTALAPRLAGAVEEVLADRTAMGAAGRAHVEAELTMAGVAARWRDLLVEVVAGR